MLDLLEKIVAGVCGFIVLCLGGMYLLLGTGSSVPAEFLEPVEIVDAPPRPAPTPTPGKPTPDTGRPAPTLDDTEIQKKLALQGVRGPISRKQARVPGGTFEYVSTEANWLKELKRYKSEIRRNRNRDGTRLALTGGVSESTLLGKFGFRDGDVIELVNGEVIDFTQDSALYYRGLAQDAIETLRNGESISLTISRGGKPVHFEFSLR